MTSFFNLPAIHAFMKELKLPANIAFAAYLSTTFALVGAKTESNAISIPIDPKLANPHKEYVAIAIERSWPFNF